MDSEIGWSAICLANGRGAVTKEGSLNDISPPQTPKTKAPSLTFDVERYRRHLAGNNLSREEEDVLLAAAWDYVARFVDIGFGISGDPRR